MLPFRFYLITNGQTQRHSQTLQQLPLLIQAGLKGLQIREKQLTPTALQQYCTAIQRTTILNPLCPQKTQCCCLVNQPPSFAALALKFNWGLHLSEAHLLQKGQGHPCPPPPKTWVGASTHSLQGVLRAQEIGLDFVVFGPIYATPSKARYGRPLGLKSLEQVSTKTRIPILALGGITPQQVVACLDAGAYGIGAMRAIWDAKRPTQSLEDFAKALGGL